MPAPDPGSFFREMLGQWEGVANQLGSELMKSGEFARTVHGATSASLKAQELAKDAMGRALSAANMPSREDIVAVGERMSAMEERLSRIESLLIKLAGHDVARVERPRPARTKKPPQSAE
jgi:hypothetical protein